MWENRPVCDSCRKVLPVPLPNPQVLAVKELNENKDLEFLGPQEFGEPTSTHIHLCSDCLLKAIGAHVYGTE